MPQKIALNSRATFNTDTATPTPSTPAFSAKWANHPAHASNQARSWPGREDPCNMSKKVQPLLQDVVDQINNGNLTPVQLAQARQDLAIIATRLFCQGHVGAGQELTVSVNGQPLQLDGVDLTLLLNKLPQQGLSIDAFEQLAQNKVRHSRAPQKISLSNPDVPPVQLPAKYTVDDIQRALQQGGVVSPLHKDMHEIIRREPVKALDAQQQNFAKQVIDLLPPAAQGKLKNVPAQLIGAIDFVEVMQAAAHEKQLPTELQHFRDSCAHNNSLKKAIYCNPNIAARILGLSAPMPGNRPSNQSTAHELATRFVATAMRACGTHSQVSKALKNFISGSSSSVAMAKQVFKALGNFAGFATQEMANVPTCFPDIQCPAASKVKANAAIHANVVSLGDGRQAVAAMQPVHIPGSDSSNLPAFYQLLASENGTTVFDLRSNTDFAQGSFDYCPDEGSSCVISNPENSEQIKITTVEKKQLQQAQSQELTVRIQMGKQAPKLVKVIQFKNWPDRGVITPEQLRSLRGLMNEELSGNQRVVTHCRAGVGRTGTLLAYENLRHKLIDLGQGQSMVDAQGKVDSNKLLQALTEVVAQGRIERGPYFVQSEDQFLLLRKTLKADLVNNFKANPGAVNAAPTASKPAAVSAPPPLHAARLPNKQIGLGKHPVSNFAPEPSNANEAFQHCQSILEAGEDTIEMLSSANRLVGAASPSKTGLGVFLDQLRQQLETKPSVQVGNNHVLSIAKVGLSQDQNKSDLVHKQTFEIRYQTVGESNIKTLSFTQFFTAFDGIKLTANQLNDTVEKLGETGGIKPKWLSSVKGVGRPSALLVAQAMREEINKGAINNEQDLIKTLDEWIVKGRGQMGPLFINSREQRLELIELGKAWLGNKQSGKPMHQGLETTGEDMRRFNWLRKALLT